MALRIRVSISAIGSVIIRRSSPTNCSGFPLPTGLAHAGNQTLVGHLAKANATQAKFAIHRSRAAANWQRRSQPRGKLGLLFCFRDFGSASHGFVISRPLSVLSVVVITGLAGTSQRLTKSHAKLSRAFLVFVFISLERKPESAQGIPAIRRCCARKSRSSRSCLEPAETCPD